MQHPRSDLNFPRQNDDCEALAPFVMALFDGEADELEAQRARAHLLVCQICARRWLDWNRSRDLLRTVPVPAPPPTLLWRVLMACRLAAFTQNRRGKSRDSSVLKPEKMRAEFAPGDLSARILAHTTRPEVSPLQRATWRPFSILALPSLAVPALAIWLFALGTNNLVAPPSQQNPASNAPAPRHAKVAAPPLSKAVLTPRVVAPKPKPARNLAPAPLKSSAPLPTSMARAEDVPTPTQPAKRALETPEIAPRRVVKAAPRPVVAALAPLSLAAAPPSRPRAALQARPRLKLVALRAAAPPRSTRLRTIQPPRLAALSSPKTAPSLRAASWKISTLQVATLVEKTAPEALLSRVALPSAPLRLAAENPAPPRLLAENLESDDERVEEMRSVVDDFRAALDPDGFQTIDFEGEAG